jgi:transcription antitermination protein NusB
MTSVGDVRREARTLALQALYEADVAGHSADSVLGRYKDDGSISQQVRRYLERLITGVDRHREEIDSRIGDAAPQFPIDQIPAIDRNVLRVAIYELTGESDVPPRAAINEAVELAKQFGGDNSSRFVNGVLGTIANDLASSH